MKKITVIPATINPLTRLPNSGIRKRRACAYARVSTDSDEQATSFAAQSDYFPRLIQSNPELEYVGLYTDEGISGTSMKKRGGFMQMMEDALDGKFDIIYTKSVSRFARNTSDFLSATRKLKEAGVEVYFEKENIRTFDSAGELLLTIMASLAQQEIKDLSTNITWGKRKSASDGKISLAYKTFLGYDKGPNGTIVINPEQAEIVKRIYREFMRGKTTWMIAQELTDDGIKTPSGRTTWRATTIESILTNEKYKGAALLQKTFTVDYLTKKTKVNEGEVPQYYIENSHEAIIPPDEWEKVQTEFTRRRSLGRKYSGNSIFATRLVCGDCGGFFGPKVWNSTSERYRKVVWQCNEKFKGEEFCTTAHFSEEEIKERFVYAFNELFDTKGEIIENCRFAADLLTNTDDLDDERTYLENEIAIVTELTKRLVNENATMALNQNAYLETYNGYVQRYDAAVARLKEIDIQITLKKSKADAFEAFIKTLEEITEPLVEFDDSIWCLVIDKVVINTDDTMMFHFTDGSSIMA